MRTYICKGKEGTMAEGETYRVEANSNAAAHGLAGRIFKEESDRPYPEGFYAMYFDVRVAEPKSPGKPSTMVLPEVEGVPA